MKQRKQLGNKNSVGAKITALRLKAGKMKQKELLAQIQTRGVDISATSLSEIEGQNRSITLEEAKVVADIFNISVDELIE